LQDVKSEDLNVLVELLVGRVSDKRISEGLTSSKSYKNHHPDHHQYWDLIAAEIQLYGGNSILNTLRGHGVLYREILCDVCDKVKVNYNKTASIETIEMNLLLKILTDSLEKMSPEDLNNIVNDLNLKTASVTPQAITAALNIALKTGGFLSYQIAVIVANAVAKAILGHGLSFVTNATLTRTISIFLGPIGWVLTGAWALVDIAGPAYRVTIPSIVQIAFLRLKQKQPKQD
jgi:uncharacterized protein YaaW (UPF0174 family)